MIHITAQMRVLVAIESVDGRKGIDSLVRVCQEKLSEDPISGCVFIFRSRRGTSSEPAEVGIEKVIPTLLRSKKS